MKYRFIQTTIFELEADDLARAQALLAVDLEAHQAYSSVEVYDENNNEVHAEYDNLPDCRASAEL